MKLTILMPVYNTPTHHLLESVYSIWNQDDGGKHHIIIINDGTDDEDTLTVIRFLKTKGIEVITLDENKGTPSAFNIGHQFAKTEYVAIMASDDISHHARFRKQIAYLENHPETDVLGTQLFSFYNHDIKRKSLWTSSHPEIPDLESFTGSNHPFIVNHGTVIYRQSAVMAAGGYNENYRRAQDVELWGRMVKKGFVFRNIPDVLYAWRRYKKTEV